MEESFAIIPIGIINDCIELIDSLLKQEKKSPSQKKALNKAKRLLTELPYNPKKDFFKLSFKKKRNHSKNLIDEYTLELDHKKFTMEYIFWKGSSGNSSVLCQFKAGDKSCAEEQFIAAQKWIHAAYRILNSEKHSVETHCIIEWG